MPKKYIILLKLIKRKKWKVPVLVFKERCAEDHAFLEVFLILAYYNYQTQKATLAKFRSGYKVNILNSTKLRVCLHGGRVPRLTGPPR